MTKPTDKLAREWRQLVYERSHFIDGTKAPIALTPNEIEEFIVRSMREYAVSQLERVNYHCSGHCDRQWCSCEAWDGVKQQVLKDNTISENQSKE